MSNKLTYFYIIFSFIFLLFLTGLYIYSSTEIKKENTVTAEKVYNKLKTSVVSSFLAKGSFNSLHVQNSINEMLKNNRTLKAVVIYSETAGIEYLYAVNTSYILSDLRSVASWKGKPEYSLRYPFEILLSGPLLIPTEKGISIDCIFEVYGKQDIFPLLQLIFILLVVFLLLTGIIIGITSTSKKHNLQIKSNSSISGTSQPFKDDRLSASSLFSPRSGLGWESFLKEKLTYELNRAASSEQELILSLLRCRNLPAGEDYKSIANLILANFALKDLVFEYGRKGYCIILPDIDIDQGIRKLKALTKRIENLDNNISPIVSIGLSSRNGRLLTGERLIKEAESSLSRAESDKTSTIITFKADLDKYRGVISSRN